MAWQIDFPYEASVVQFVEIPMGARPLFDLAEEIGEGHVIADIDGTVATRAPDGESTTFAAWCRANLRGRSKRMRAAREVAIERGWMSAPKTRSKT